MAAYTLNAYLRTFLECPATIFKTPLLEFYSRAVVTDDNNISFSKGDYTLVITEDLLASTFALPTSGLQEFSSISRATISEMMKLFSANDEELSPSCDKKDLKMEFQILADIVSKAIMVRGGTFNKITKEKATLMTVITRNQPINWASVIFKYMVEMVAKKASGFAVQISKLLKDAGFPSTTDNLGTRTTMIDADNVLLLRPVASSSQLLSVKQSLGSRQEGPQKKPTKKQVIVVSDSEHTLSEGSAAPPPPAPTPAKKKQRTSRSSRKASSKVSEAEDRLPLLQVFKSIPVPAVSSSLPSTGAESSTVLIAPRPLGGVVIQEPLPEATRSGLSRPSASDKGKGKMPAAQEDDEDTEPISSVQTAIDLQMEQVDQFAADEISFFDEWVRIRTFEHLSSYKGDKPKFIKAVKLERRALAAAKTMVVPDALTRRAYILETLKVKKLGEILVVLKANYDYQSPTAHHDAAVISQLSNDLMTLSMGVTVMELDFSAPSSGQPSSSIPAAVPIQPVEERATLPSQGVVSSTPEDFGPAEPTTSAAPPTGSQQTSSLMSVRDFSAVEDVVSSLLTIPEAPLTTAADSSPIPDLTMFSAEHQQEMRESVADPEPILPSAEAPFSSSPATDMPQEPVSAETLAPTAPSTELTVHPDEHPAAQTVRTAEILQRLRSQDDVLSPPASIAPLEEDIDQIRSSCHTLESLVKEIKYDQLAGATAFDFFRTRVMDHVSRIEKELTSLQLSHAGFRSSFAASQADLLVNQTSLSTTVNHLDSKVDTLSAQMVELFQFLRDADAKKGEERERDRAERERERAESSAAAANRARDSTTGDRSENPDPEPIDIPMAPPPPLHFYHID